MHSIRKKERMRLLQIIRVCKIIRDGRGKGDGDGVHEGRGMGWGWIDGGSGDRRMGSARVND